MAFDNAPAVRSAIKSASHILSSVPPDRSGRDPVLAEYGRDIAASQAQWIGYLSSTGVYGDTGGAWVDESARIGSGRRSARAQADLDWQALSNLTRVFRLPGIYGPGRSPFDRLRSDQAQRIDAPGQVFSRIHVADIVSAVMASLDAPAGVYNIADNCPAPQHEVIAHAAILVGMPVPPLQSLETADLSDMARAFYSENRRVANGKAKRVMGWMPAFPDYRSGLEDIFREA